MKYLVVLTISILLYLFTLHAYFENIVSNVFSGKIYERGVNSKNLEVWVILFVLAIFLWGLFQYFIYKSPSKKSEQKSDPLSKPNTPDAVPAQEEPWTDVNRTAPSPQIGRRNAEPLERNG